MNRSMSAAAAFAAILGASLLFPARGAAPQEKPAPPRGEQEEGFKNLKVFPKDIPHDDLIAAMRGFAGALGVRCDFCHMDDAAHPHHLDFASDGKDTKKIARVMMKMNGDINAQYISTLDLKKADAMQVKCVTCHRGLPIPRDIGDVVADTLEANGPDAAAATYKTLRDQYYGSASYDFSEGALNDLAEQLAAKEKLDEAVQVLKLNQQYYPDSSRIYSMLGQIYAGQGKKDEAVTAMQKAISLDPQNPRLKQMLDRIQNGGGNR